MDIRTGLGVVLLAAAILLGLVSPRSASAASVAVDAASDAVLSAEAPNHLWYPASLTKLTTVYVALARDALKPNCDSQREAYRARRAGAVFSRPTQ